MTIQHNPLIGSDCTSFTTYAASTVMARIIEAGKHYTPDQPYPNAYLTFATVRAIQPCTKQPICSRPTNHHWLWKEMG